MHQEDKLIDPQTGTPTTEGRLQMYLVLGALACGDLEDIQAFRDHQQAINGRNEMYTSHESFRARAPIALTNAGFSPNFVGAIQWDNFTPEIFNALSAVRSQLRLFATNYDAPDCPCISV